MTNTPDEPPKPSRLPGDVFTNPKAISSFVTYAALAFEAHGAEFLDDGSDPLMPTYGVNDMAYDSTKTPNLAPYKTVSITAADLSRIDGPTHIEFKFDISPDTLPPKTIVRWLELWSSGEVVDNTLDYSKNKKADPTEPTKPASHSREDIRAYMDYILGKEALREAIDELEGLPKVPVQLSVAEVEDLINLLP